jgi:hypothetical protein
MRSWRLAGSVLGASLTYKLARKGGKETLHRRLRQWRMDKVREMLVNYGVIGASGSEISRESDPVACGVALVRRPFTTALPSVYANPLWTAVRIRNKEQESEFPGYCFLIGSYGPHPLAFSARRGQSPPIATPARAATWRFWGKISSVPPRRSECRQGVP